MAEKGMGEGKKHTLSLLGRTALSVSGVTEVESFDEQSVLLKTDCGDLTIEGTELHVGTLDIARGVVEITGRVGGVYYADAAVPKRGWRARLFG